MLSNGVYDTFMDHKTLQIAYIDTPMQNTAKKVQILKFSKIIEKLFFSFLCETTQNTNQGSQKQSGRSVGKLRPCSKASKNKIWTCAHQAQARIDDNRPKIENRPKSCIIDDSRPIWLVPDVRNSICSRNDAPDPCASNGGSHVVGRHTGAILRASQGARISKSGSGRRFRFRESLLSRARRDFAARGNPRRIAPVCRPTTCDPPLDAHGSGASFREQIGLRTSGTSQIGLESSIT